MVRVEDANRPNPDSGNTRVASPVDLMRENPAALIVNRESYGRMAAHFSTDQLDPPKLLESLHFLRNMEK